MPQTGKFLANKYRDGSISPATDFCSEIFEYALQEFDFAKSFANIFTIGFRKCHIIVVSLLKY